MPTVGEALREAERAIRESEAIEQLPGKARSNAEELLEAVLGRDELDDDEELRADQLTRFRRLVARRVTGVPVAYIIGRTTFLDVELEVTRGSFIPRSSTEFMAEQAIRRLRRRTKPIHVDLATGIGPIPLAVAHAVPKARVFGVDLFPAPVRQAKRNAERLKLRNVTFLRGDLFDPLPSDIRGEVDAITIHPPYVGAREVRELPDEIRAFEPVESLTDNSREGMGIIGRVVGEAPSWLRSGGWLLIEVSPDRSRKVATLMRRGGFRDVRSTKSGWDDVSRVIVGRA